MKELQRKLQQIDGKSYKGYKGIQGRYSFHRYELVIDYVQGDPFASPSKIRLIVPDAYRRINPDWKENRQRKIYSEDRIARAVAKAIKHNTMHSKGSGKSGLIAIDSPGQEILERSSVQLDPGFTTICLSIGLPANGRRINGREAEKLFFEVIPAIMEKSIFSISDEEIEASVQLADQHQAIRKMMKENGWISFIADGAILPRQSGISNRPMKQAVPFESTVENRVSIEVPHRKEPLTGMALSKGIVLIVGGGYHGKSTLLHAIERGVYHHIKGDGREYVLTDPTAVKVRAEDGREVSTVDISPFINDLPHLEDTSRFSTENASGSTSQAANVVEALEAGAGSVLIDEDTSATNFMIRDQRMQELVVKEKEPITPFIDKIRQMRDQLDVSTILVMGGSGDYFDAADQVIMMDRYQPYNVTDRAREIAEKYPFNRQHQDSEPFGSLPNRRFLPGSLQTSQGKKHKVQAKGLTTIIMGRTDINLHYVEQLVDASQTRMIAEIIRHLDQKKWLANDRSLTELLDAIEAQIDQKGLASFAPFPDQHPGDLARPRRFEIAATLNRIRTAKVKDISNS
ncbi:ABC-ATPase domain-containing protein [Sediminibacillus halophilus]|uniref:Predicted ATPase of the ABC class n=1 Tax=Sediminibacillus halophilus TaxID=482461 RepID=A0A1G9W3E4_9BACI|nr:ABC-ATPase domain-containing protein [Sediminibacillus halophilus]SDM78717.1 Predicted ATPase of the ABC class [Sediminibacillus halophilus]